MMKKLLFIECLFVASLLFFMGCRVSYSVAVAKKGVAKVTNENKKVLSELHYDVDEDGNAELVVSALVKDGIAINVYKQKKGKNNLLWRTFIDCDGASEFIINNKKCHLYIGKPSGKMPKGIYISVELPPHNRALYIFKYNKGKFKKVQIAEHQDQKDNFRNFFVSDVDWKKGDRMVVLKDIILVYGKHYWNENVFIGEYTYQWDGEFFLYKGVKRLSYQ